MTTTPKPGQDDDDLPLEGPGHSFVPVWGIVLVAIYLIVATSLCIVAISQMWPHPTPSGELPKDDADKKAAEKRLLLTPEYLSARCGTYDAAPSLKNAEINDCRACERRAHALRDHFRTGEEENDPECIQIFRWDVVMWNERRLMLIVVLSGMLGGLLYANRSFFWYVGNRKMVRSWVPIYFFAPLTSALLGLIIYLVIRGGFFSGISTIGDTSPYAFAAVAVLVGMHHRETAEKLKEIFEVVFTKAKAGKNDADNPKPTLVSVISDPTPVSRTVPSKLTLTGQGFIDGSVVRIGGKDLAGKATVNAGIQLIVDVQPGEVADAADEIEVTVFNGEPGGGVSNPKKVKVEPKTP